MPTGAPYVEDLDVSRACIPKLAEPNKNNSVVWTTKIHASPDTSDSLVGQMSFWAQVLYVITPGKDKTAQTHPDGNRNCDMVIEPIHRKFIEKCQALDDVALKHMLANKDHYYEGEELTDKQVMKRHRKLIVPTKEGDMMVLRTKMRPTVRKDKKGKLVANPRATRMTRVDENDEDAEEYSSIDEVHPSTSSRDYVQNVLDFIGFYRSDAYFGINVLIPQGWHKTKEYASYSRNKRKSADVSGGAAQPTQARAKDQENAPDQTQDVEDDYGDYE